MSANRSRFLGCMAAALLAGAGTAGAQSVVTLTPDRIPGSVATTVQIVVTDSAPCMDGNCPSYLISNPTDCLDLFYMHQTGTVDNARRINVNTRVEVVATPEYDRSCTIVAQLVISSVGDAVPSGTVSPAGFTGYAELTVIGAKGPDPNPPPPDPPTPGPTPSRSPSRSPSRRRRRRPVSKWSPSTARRICARCRRTPP